MSYSNIKVPCIYFKLAYRDGKLYYPGIIKTYPDNFMAYSVILVRSRYGTCILEYDIFINK